MILILISSLFSFLSYSHAEPVSNVYHAVGSPVDETAPLSIRGKGIRDKKTKETLYIACVDQSTDCGMMQFILVKRNRTAVWWSDPFQFKTKKDFKKVMKNLDRRSKGDEEGLRILRVFCSVMLVMGATAVTMVFVGTGVGIGVLAGAFTLMGLHGDGFFDIVTLTPRAISSAQNAHTFNETLDRDGWNWPEKTVGMRHPKFKRLKHVLEDGFFLKN